MAKKKEIEVKNLQEAQEKLQELQKDGSINKPTEGEINLATKEFNDKAAEFNAKRFNIGTPEEANEIYDFVIDYMENHVYWTKNGWMGVIKMHEELTAAKNNRKDGDSFNVAYQALEFMFYALTNPGGSGLQSAKAVEKVADLYAHVIELSAKVLEAARKELKDIQWLQDKVTAMQQGFYLEKEDGVEKVTPVFSAPTANDLINKK